MLEDKCIVYHGFKDLKTIIFSVCCIVWVFLGIGAICYKNVLSVHEINLPIPANEN